MVKAITVHKTWGSVDCTVYSSSVAGSSNSVVGCVTVYHS